MELGHFAQVVSLSRAGLHGDATRALTGWSGSLVVRLEHSRSGERFVEKTQLGAAVLAHVVNLFVVGVVR